MAGTRQLIRMKVYSQLESALVGEAKRSKRLIEIERIRSNLCFLTQAKQNVIYAHKSNHMIAFCFRSRGISCGRNRFNEMLFHTMDILSKTAPLCPTDIVQDFVQLDASGTKWFSFENSIRQVG